MGNGLHNGCKCRCPGDDDINTNIDMQMPAYPGAQSYIKKTHEMDGHTGGTGGSKEPTFGCTDLNSTWCCPEGEQGNMVTPMPQPVLDPVFAAKDTSMNNRVMEQAVPDPYAQEQGMPGLAFPQRDFRETSNMGQSNRTKSSDRTSSSGRTASEWAADQAQFSHLPPLPPGWLRVVSRTTGKLYYCYPETGETTFQEPTGPPASIANAKQLPPGWVEMVSRSTGRTYFWNAELQKSQFEIPTGFESPGSPATSGSTSGPPTGQEDPTLPPGWTVMVSRSTGKTYYYHAASQQSQFERPTS